MAERRAYLAFDVGGSYIKAAAVDDSGRVIEGTPREYAAHSDAPKEAIIARFADMIGDQTARIPGGAHVLGIGYAFPGPFDYARGVSYIKGQAKFEQLYGIPFRDELRKAVDGRGNPALGPDYSVVFENDANLFGLGEAFIGKGRPYARSMYITIGTGTGAAFVDEGRMITARADIPPDAEVFDFPFGDGIVDDYISRRGVLRLAAEAGFDTGRMDVVDVASAARRGDEAAQRVFARFGGQLGQMLVPFVERFKPEAVILGRQISKSYALFEGTTRRTMDEAGIRIPVLATDDSQSSVFAGIARWIMNR